MNTKSWKQIKDEVYGQVGTERRDQLDRDFESFRDTTDHVFGQKTVSALRFLQNRDQCALDSFEAFQYRIDLGKPVFVAATATALGFFGFHSSSSLVLCSGYALSMDPPSFFSLQCLPHLRKSRRFHEEHRFGT